jgi:hypothetical protein
VIGFKAQEGRRVPFIDGGRKRTPGATPTPTKDALALQRPLPN